MGRLTPAHTPPPQGVGRNGPELFKAHLAFFRLVQKAQKCESRPDIEFAAATDLKQALTFPASSYTVFNTFLKLHNLPPVMKHNKRMVTLSSCPSRPKVGQTWKPKIIPVLISGPMA